MNKQKNTDIKTKRPSLSAVICDLDGVLTDTETLFLAAINQLLSDENFQTLKFEEARQLVGLDNESIWKQLNRLRGLGLSMEEYTQRIDLLARDRFEKDLVPIPGAIDFLSKVREMKIPLALATSADRDRALLRLRLMDIETMFDAIITRNEVKIAKPDPSIYIEASRQIGVEPSLCLAIEDSRVGMESARSAGMYTIAVKTVWSTPDDFEASNDVVDKLADIDLPALFPSNIPNINSFASGETK
jgi:HAD superfamily hydrolase (TIGR01509 family)